VSDRLMLLLMNFSKIFGGGSFDEREYRLKSHDF